MKKQFGLALALLCQCSFMSAQIDEKLREDIRTTGYVHSPLPLDYSKAYETYGITKKVLVSDMLCDMESMDRWSHKGIGSIAQTDERSQNGQHSLRLTAPSRPDKLPDWGLGLGTCMATLDAGGANWEKYNRIRFYVYPDCEGARSIYLNLYVENEGKIKIPDKYGREGYHEINLVNRQWNECFVEMTELARDKVTKLSFAIEVFGKERTMGDSLQFDVDGIELQAVENPEVVSGWAPAENRIIYSTTGYRPGSKKSAIVRTGKHDGTFSLLDYKSNRPVYTGEVKSVKSPIGSFETVDFSAFREEGEYLIKVGDVVTPFPFYINNNVWENSAWRVTNFMFVERCGYPVPEKHGACHTDLNGEHNGHLFTANGGWHDAADMSQVALQTGETAFAFFEMAQKAKEKGNTDLYLRLMEEAQWGLDYIMKTRLGDGYRVQAWWTNLWTDGLVGTIDDAGGRQVYAHNGTFENFLLSGIEAYASTVIEKDRMLKENLRKIAREDFEFAIKRFEETEYNALFGEGAQTGAVQSQYMATIAWAAGMLYKLTGEKYYADKAADAIKYTIQCQRTEPLKDKNKTRGFFYRNLARRSIVHFAHQSRDNIFMQSLVTLCEALPSHPDYPTWVNAIKLYGEYLKSIMPYVQPYGMLPSGVYHVDEVKDSTAFYSMHIGISRGGAEADYKEQLENGFRLDKEHYLRAFPVWFSFKGNTAVHLATGKSAALCGKFLNDPELIDIAEQQLFWIVGKNPFGQSLIWGEGSNYMQQYVALPGETVGEIPVGIQSRFNEDTPYWPQFNTATYKEVWATAAGKWLSLISEF
jgi:hypothetical protein